MEENAANQHSLIRQHPSRHYHRPTQCDTNVSANKIVYPENKGLLSILTPTDGQQQSVISHISHAKDSPISNDNIQLVTNPNKKGYGSESEQYGHQFSSTFSMPSKAVNLRCSQNDDSSNSDTGTIQKSVHFEELPRPQRVSN